MVSDSFPSNQETDKELSTNLDNYQFGCVTIDLINLRSFYYPLDTLQPNKFMNIFSHIFFTNGHIPGPRWARN